MTGRVGIKNVFRIYCVIAEILFGAYSLTVSDADISYDKASINAHAPKLMFKSNSDIHVRLTLDRLMAAS